ncbi:MAG: hypothetical protein K0R17_1624 [Rariglobus sp.]|jgi:hypothetical protein|nr:hypothetical protein [Rariglobus sp.]
MRLFVCLVFFAIGCRLVAGPTPPELEAALKNFRAEGAKGWAFTQTTVSDARSRVERFDPLGRHFLQWTLVQQDGRAPTANEIRTYNEHKTRRSSNETAPNVKDQIAPGTCEVVDDTPERGVYRFQLKPGDKDDHSAQFMRVTFTLHRPTATIEKVELASTGPFSPVFMVNIQEARTVMTYLLPEGERPTLLKEVSVRVRGRAMWVKSLDQDMTVAYSDYSYAGKE